MTDEAIEAAALLPCPFCGEEYAEMSHYTTASSPKEPAGYYVECGYCSAAGPPFEVQGEMPYRHEYTKAEAIAAWNRRAPGWRAMETAPEKTQVLVYIPTAKRADAQRRAWDATLREVDRGFETYSSEPTIMIPDPAEVAAARSQAAAISTDAPAPADPEPGAEIDCATVCTQGCIRPESCPSAEARARVEALLNGTSLDELVSIATNSLESRTRARFDKDPGFNP